MEGNGIDRYWEGSHFCMRESLLTLVRGVALAALVVIPWLYGGTPDWTIEWISNGLLGLTLAALIAWPIAGRWPRLGWVLPVTLVLLALGWIAALNPKFRYDEMLKILFPLEGVATPVWLPGSVDSERSLSAMKRLTGLIGLLWILRDMCTISAWRKSVIWTIAVAGCSVAAHGIMQKTSGDLLGYWQGKTLPVTVFAGFWYHANAAAFLNLTWPFVAVLTLESFVRGKNHLARALLLAGTLLMLAAVLVNVSKAGHLLFLGLVPLLMWLVLPGFLRAVTNQEEIRKSLLFCVAGILFTGVVLAMAFGLDKAVSRWEEMDAKRWVGDSRYDSVRFCLGEIPRAGWSGFGPGTFEVVFLDVGTTHPEKVPPLRWKFAHQDSLQTLLEWGWLGGALWVALGLGLLAATARHMWQMRHGYFSTRHAYYSAAFVGLLGVALHAQMDFPLQILGVQVMVIAVAALGSTQDEQSKMRRRSRRARDPDYGELNVSSESQP